MAGLTPAPARRRRARGGRQLLCCLRERGALLGCWAGRGGLQRVGQCFDAARWLPACLARALWLAVESPPAPPSRLLLIDPSCACLCRPSCHTRPRCACLPTNNARVHGECWLTAEPWTLLRLLRRPPAPPTGVRREPGGQRHQPGCHDGRRDVSHRLRQSGRPRQRHHPRLHRAQPRADLPRWAAATPAALRQLYPSGGLGGRVHAAARPAARLGHASPAPQAPPPLPAVRAGWTGTVHREAPAVTGVGLEKLTIEFAWSQVGEHFTGEGSASRVGAAAQHGWAPRGRVPRGWVLTWVRLAWAGRAPRLGGQPSAKRVDTGPDLTRRIPWPVLCTCPQTAGSTRCSSSACTTPGWTRCAWLASQPARLPAYVVGLLSPQVPVAAALQAPARWHHLAHHQSPPPLTLLPALRSLACRTDLAAPAPASQVKIINPDNGLFMTWVDRTTVKGARRRRLLMSPARAPARPPARQPASKVPCTGRPATCPQPRPQACAPRAPPSSLLPARTPS